MMKMLLSFMIIMFSLIMFFLNHPMSMGLMLLLQTLLTCLLTGMLIKTYWFSYILFLTFLGGLLVMFIYVSSIASNEMFFISSKMKILFLTLSFISIMLSINFMLNINWMIFYFNEDMTFFPYKFIFFNNENKINMSNLYNNQTFLLMMMLIIYLFITLISVVKITNIFYGPLRSMN